MPFTLWSSIALVLVVAQTPGGLGRIEFPNSGSPAAQTPFLRGVALLHSFEYDDAIVAFRQAQTIAPGFAMAYWGEALCYSQPLWYRDNVAKARDTMTRLGVTSSARAARAPTEREKGYLDAVERLFGRGTRSARAAAYAARMAALSAAYPADDDAAAFHALALLATIPEGQRDVDVSLKAGALASTVLQRSPHHPGAAHYALHAYDDGEHNRLGLEAARAYARIAPQSSHALHMPSHVFLPLGMWDEAAASNEAAFTASVAWVTRTGRSVAQQDFHSLSWLHYAYLQQGRFAKARETADLAGRALDASAGNRPGSDQHGHHVESEIGRGYASTALGNELASMRARAIVESRDWAQMKGRQTFDNIDELFALGLSSVALGDLARAETAIVRLRHAATTGTDRDLRDVVAIMADELQGVVQFARGDRSGGLAALARATAAESRRPRPIARPYPIKPAGELYGELLLAAGDASGAVLQFQAALARTPRRAASLLGLAHAAAAASDQITAARVAREFVGMWDKADPDRPEMADARMLLQ